MRVYLKTAEEIEKLGRANQAVRKTLDEIELAVKPGVSTWQLNEVADRTLKKLGATSAFLGYHGYPAVLCTSVNHEVIHGIPNDRGVLKSGDVVSIDCGVVIDGYYSWRLKQRELYLRGLEKALAASYAAIQRAPSNRRELNKLATVLEGVRVGANSQIRRFDWSDAWFNEPVMLFKGLYPVMIGAAVVATAVFGVHAIKADHDQEGLAECKDGVRVTLASPLHVRSSEITVPPARAECSIDSASAQAAAHHP